eukprot:m.351422 g.351422  ORF g.351422 m.351422 type:complete len:78 (+) comp16241_c0_seq1:4382-4615(+)
MKVYQLIRLVHERAVIAPSVNEKPAALSKQLAHHRLWTNLQSTFQTVENPERLATCDVEQVSPQPKKAKPQAREFSV